MSRRSLTDVLSSSDAFHAFKGVTEEVILKAENEIGAIFSPEYREYLRTYGVASIKGHELTGLGSSARLSVVVNTLDERKIHPNLEKRFYVVEQCNIDGLVVLQENSGLVYILNTNQNVDKVSNSLAEYIEITSTYN